MPQNYKAVYFPDLPGDTSRQRSLTIAFGQKTRELYETIKDLSSAEIRQLLGSNSYQDLTARAYAEELPINTYCLRQLKKTSRFIRESQAQIALPTLDSNERLFDPITVTFRGGSREPFIRWYPYLEGYSPQFVEAVLERYAPNANVILDPFAGTATTAFVASQLGKSAYFCEINPILQFIDLTKIRVRQLESSRRIELARDMVTSSDALDVLERFQTDYTLHQTYQHIFGNSEFFDRPVYEQVLRIRTWIDEVSLKKPLLADLITIAVLSALVPASMMKRAGDLRYKRPRELKETVPLIETIKQNIHQMAADISGDVNGLQTTPILICENVHCLAHIPQLNVDTVVTSPPYVNGTNYFRNTKIELWFLRCLRERNDLAKLRYSSLTAGINDVTVSKIPQDSHPEVERVVKTLEEASYDLRIPRMIKCYFNEIALAFHAIGLHLTPDATVAVDIGDSSYANVHVPVDDLLTVCLQDIGYELEDKIVLRKRWSRGGAPLKQVLLVFKFHPKQPLFRVTEIIQPWIIEWTNFKLDLPHQKPPYSKRNWGHVRHSLCSYPGKLKPSIASHLVKIFVPEGGSVLDPFAGVGTIPFEAALQGKKSYGFELSPSAFIIASAKLQCPSREESINVIEKLEKFIKNATPTDEELSEAQTFGFNGKIVEYYESRTLREVILARRYFQTNPPEAPAEFLVFASLLHILHGNRPYALSRRSHPITPYKPTGPFEYRSLIHQLATKAQKELEHDLPEIFQPGKIFLHDATSWWPQEIDELDAVITSPPFFDSTRYYLANWLRLWFAGWSQRDFETRPLGFVDERQKKGFDVYIPILRQSRERLRSGGVLIFHLGKSIKCDMTNELSKIAKTWFRSVDIFDESVTHCESHGIRDKGTVTSHQYLVLY